VIPSFLTIEELTAVSQKDFDIQCLDQVRDIFLFSCYTGLAYVDVQKLSRSEIVTGQDGYDWVITARQKTKTLLPAAKNIMAKYEAHSQSKFNGKLLPV